MNYTPILNPVSGTVNKKSQISLYEYIVNFFVTIPPFLKKCSIIKVWNKFLENRSARKRNQPCDKIILVINWNIKIYNNVTKL